MQRLVILGVCGKLMAGVAAIAKEMGWVVVGYDQQFAQPMLSVLQKNNINMVEGYPNTLMLEDSDCVIVGNQLRRSEPVIQDLISKRVKMYSAPEWLMTYVLRNRYVIAVTGSHGKTTITAMIAWMLSQLGESPGYLIGGVIPQLGGCAALGNGRLFVIEADEYDTAFFDKRPKFMHYWPNILVISHLEFDHADIYNDIIDLQKQFKYLLRLLPSDGKVISTNISNGLIDQINAFNLSSTQYGRKQSKLSKNKGAQPAFNLTIPGQFNEENAHAAYLVATQLGLKLDRALLALNTFEGVDRRQKKMISGVITAYDDFAHHPTALAEIFQTFKSQAKMWLVYHPATYTQRCGKMDDAVIKILTQAKGCILLPPKHNIPIKRYRDQGVYVTDTEALMAAYLEDNVMQGDTIIVCSAYYLSSFWQLLLERFQKNMGQELLFHY